MAFYKTKCQIVNQTIGLQDFGSWSRVLCLRSLDVLLYS